MERLLRWWIELKIDYLFLHRRHQLLVALLLAVSVLAVAGYFCLTRLVSGKLIDIDEALPVSVTFQVDLNTADWPELSVLPGIGEKLAHSIVEHRTRIGVFRRHEQLMDIEGIGEAKLSALKPFLLPTKYQDRPE